jgi:hypothetical protein
MTDGLLTVNYYRNDATAMTLGCRRDQCSSWEQRVITAQACYIGGDFRRLPFGSPDAGGDPERARSDWADWRG